MQINQLSELLHATRSSQALQLLRHRVGGICTFSS